MTCKYICPSLPSVEMSTLGLTLMLTFQLRDIYIYCSMSHSPSFIYCHITPQTVSANCRDNCTFYSTVAVCVVMCIQTCVEEGRDFTAEFEAAWDCYLPFVRRYGDSLSVGFQSVSYFAENKVSGAVLLPSFVQGVKYSIETSFIDTGMETNN